MTTSKDQVSCVGELYQILSGTNHTTVLGSKLGTKTIDQFLESKAENDDAAFNAFRSRITQVIRALSGQSDVNVTGMHDVRSFMSCSSTLI